MLIRKQHCCFCNLVLYVLCLHSYMYLRNVLVVPTSKTMLRIVGNLYINCYVCFPCVIVDLHEYDLFQYTLSLNMLPIFIDASQIAPKLENYNSQQLPAHKCSLNNQQTVMTLSKIDNLPTSIDKVR